MLSSIFHRDENASDAVPKAVASDPLIVLTLNETLAKPSSTTYKPVDTSAFRKALEVFKKETQEIYDDTLIYSSAYDDVFIVGEYSGEQGEQGEQRLNLVTKKEGVQKENHFTREQNNIIKEERVKTNKKEETGPKITKSFLNQIYNEDTEKEKNEKIRKRKREEEEEERKRVNEENKRRKKEEEEEQRDKKRIEKEEKKKKREEEEEEKKMKKRKANEERKKQQKKVEEEEEEEEEKQQKKVEEQSEEKEEKESEESEESEEKKYLDSPEYLGYYLNTHPKAELILNSDENKRNQYVKLRSRIGKTQPVYVQCPIEDQPTSPFFSKRHKDGHLFTAEERRGALSLDGLNWSQHKSTKTNSEKHIKDYSKASIFSAHGIITKNEFLMIAPLLLKLLMKRSK